MPNHGGPHGGYNGGGPDNGNTGDFSYGGGGGATDIRLIGGDWDDDNSLLSRFIVAGGSGGSHEQPWGRGGYGGGTNGYPSLSEGEFRHNYADYYAEGGTQNDGGNIGPSCTRTKGTFGKGGQGYDAGGGGGGWFGGGGGCLGIGGGGGSGFILNQTSFLSVPTNYKVGSDFFLVDGKTISGNETFLNPEGVEETGHFGHGFAIITILNLNPCSPYLQNIYSIENIFVIIFTLV